MKKLGVRIFANKKMDFDHLDHFDHFRRRFPLNPSIESTTLGVALIFSIPGRCGAKRVGLAFQEGGLLQAFHGRRRVV